MAKRAEIYLTITLNEPSASCWRNAPTIGPERGSFPHSGQDDLDHFSLMGPPYTNK